VQGRDLIVKCLGEGKKKVIIGGAIHGDEQNTVAMVESLYQKFLLLSIPADTSICFLPALNIDGVKNNTRRNANNVDLNRNWDTKNWITDAQGPTGIVPGSGGAFPFSEPETRSFADFLLQNQSSTETLVVLMYHSRYPPNGLVQPAYTIDSGNYIPHAQSATLAKYFASSIGSTFSVTYEGGYTITGEMINWCGEKGLTCFDVELPDRTQPTIDQIQKHYEAILGILNNQ